MSATTCPDPHLMAPHPHLMTPDPYMLIANSNQQMRDKHMGVTGGFGGRSACSRLKRSLFMSVCVADGDLSSLPVCVKYLYNGVQTFAEDQDKSARIYGDDIQTALNTQTRYVTPMRY